MGKKRKRGNEETIEFTTVCDFHSQSYCVQKGIDSLFVIALFVRKENSPKILCLQFDRAMMIVSGCSCAHKTLHLTKRGGKVNGLVQVKRSMIKGACT